MATRTLWIEKADGSGARTIKAAGKGVYTGRSGRRTENISYTVRDNALWVIDTDGGKPERVLGPLTEEKDLFGFYGFVAYDEFDWFQS